MQPKIVTLLGISGSGKGTQAKMLVEKFNWEYLGTGELLRARKKQDDFTGKKIGTVIDKGKFMSTVVMIKLWMDRLEEIKAKSKDFRGFVLDGSPRKLMEAEIIDQALDWYEWKDYFYILLIEISEEETMLRLSNRWTCGACGKIYSYLERPREEGVCNECGGKLTQRADDTPEGIRGRINEFNKEVRPVIDYYEKSGRLIRIKGEQSIEDVHKDILTALESN